MSDNKELSTEELQQKAYEALRSYRERWRQVDIEKLVAEGVLKPVSGGYEVLDHSRLPEAANKLLKGVKAGKLILSKPDKKALAKIDKFFGS